MIARYYLDPSGAKTASRLGRSGGGHLEIGQEILAAKAIVPVDSADVYTQMFRLNYIRVVEHEDGLVEVEHTDELSSGQQQFFNSLKHSGKTLRYIKRKC
ncbi:MAG TPA: hypothetical protein VEC99_10295 [Clostridia bacterium]|nr:hypothetical protein [Clostridia bacterium]